jgi:hypothetical protein
MRRGSTTNTDPPPTPSPNPSPNPDPNPEPGTRRGSTLCSICRRSRAPSTAACVSSTVRSPHGASLERATPTPNPNPQPQPPPPNPQPQPPPPNPQPQPLTPTLTRRAQHAARLGRARTGRCPRGGRCPPPHRPHGVRPLHRVHLECLSRRRRPVDPRAGGPRLGLRGRSSLLKRGEEPLP